MLNSLKELDPSDYDEKIIALLKIITAWDLCLSSCLTCAYRMV